MVQTSLLLHNDPHCGSLHSSVHFSHPWALCLMKLAATRCPCIAPLPRTLPCQQRCSRCDDRIVSVSVSRRSQCVQCWEHARPDSTQLDSNAEVQCIACWYCPLCSAASSQKIKWIMCILEQICCSQRCEKCETSAQSTATLTAEVLSSKPSKRTYYRARHSSSQ